MLKSYKQFENEEMTEMSPRSQYIAEKLYKADGQLILVKSKRGWSIMPIEKVLIIS